MSFKNPFKRFFENRENKEQQYKLLVHFLGDKVVLIYDRDDHPEYRTKSAFPVEVVAKKIKKRKSSHKDIDAFPLAPGSAVYVKGLGFIEILSYAPDQAVLEKLNSLEIKQLTIEEIDKFIHELKDKYDDLLQYIKTETISKFKKEDYLEKLSDIQKQILTFALLKEKKLSEMKKNEK